MDDSGRRPPTPPPGPPAVRGEAAPQSLPGEVAELVGELSEPTSHSRPYRLADSLVRIAGRTGRRGWHSIRSAVRWLTTETLALVPRIPVRDLETLRAQFPGLPPEDLAEALIQGASRASAGVGAAAGAAMILPLPAAPIEIAVETLTLVGIEVKLTAELHEVYGLRAPGPTTDRMQAYLGAWSHRRGVVLGPTGVILAVGSPLRRRLQRRLIARAGRSATSLGPLLTGALAGAALNRRETRRLGNDVREDLRRRSPYTARWSR
ncbi:MAG TPA: hypothetical protein VGJ50_16580 [Streptosporangiaceae bacterium]|jgi:hypothetical protein